MKSIYYILFFFAITSQCYTQNYSATWERIYPKNAPERRFYHSMVQISENKVILFAGSRVLTDIQSHFNDTWIFDLKDTSWTKIETTIKPSERYAHDMIAIDSNTVFMFGGVNEHRDDFQRDVWYFDTKLLQWEAILSDTANSPPEFIYWPMCKMSNDTIIVFGYDSECCFYHFYYNIKEKKWYKDNLYHKMQPKSGCKFLNLNDNEVFTFGGFNVNGGSKNSSWIMNKHTLDWKEIFPENKPQKLYDYAMQKITNNDVFAFGGFANPDTCEVSQQLWLFDYEKNNWFNITPTLSPKGRDGHSIAKLNDSTFMMFSGMAYCHDIFTPESDTWLLHLKRNVTSLEEEILLNNLKYNETQNTIQINNIEIGSIIQIFDILGNLIESKQITTNQMQFNKLDYPIGIYIIKVQDKNKTFTNKFIVLK